MYHTVASLVKRYSQALIVLAAIGFVVCASVVLSYIYIAGYAKYTIDDSAFADTFGGEPPVAIVLGGGIDNGYPRPHVQDRLDAAARLLDEGKVRKLLVSGDNRFADYNEPEAMKNYLIKQKNLPEDAIQIDHAGRSTYETCERAKKVYGLDKALLVTQVTHLPRAIYLCRAFDIEAYGYNSSGPASASWQARQRWREVMARPKALINVHVRGEQTVLGDQVPLY